MRVQKKAMRLENKVLKQRTAQLEADMCSYGDCDDDSEGEANGLGMENGIGTFQRAGDILEHA